MKLKSIPSLFLVLALACVGLTCLHAQSFEPQSQPPKYNVTILPLPAHYYIEDLNNLGEIVGGGLNPNTQVPNAFLYANGTLISLGSLGGYASAALAINDASQIVGWSSISIIQAHAFLYENGTMTDLGSLGGANTSQGNAINNAGQIAGWSSDPNTPSRAVVFWKDKIIKFGPSGTEHMISSYVNGINDHYTDNGLGQCVGQFVPFNANFGTKHAFFYSNTRVQDIHFVCQNASIPVSTATNINNLGQIIGTCGTGITSTAFFYDTKNEKHYFIGRYGSTVIDINDAGQVIGMATNSTFFENRYPFLFMDGIEYALSDLILPDPVLTYIEPAAINNKGQIIANTAQGAVLLTPISQEYEK